MSTNGRDRTLAALTGQAADTRPVWLMRQAGRFLPEYRALREAASAEGKGFLDFCRSPELCTEAALQPLRRFDLDATIVFSDILVVPDALGCGVSFEKGEGPRLDRPLRPGADLNALPWAEACGALGFVYDAVRALRRAAPTHGLYGFAGSPWTLLAYMIQGAGGGDFTAARASIYADPEWATQAMCRLADVVAEHLRRQADAGADVVQVFDSWGGLLPAEDWAALQGPALRRLREQLAGVPVVLFVREGPHLVGEAARLGFDALAVDATVDLGSVPGVSQGNLDNVRLLAGRAAVDAGVARAAAQLRGRGGGHVWNLGQGLLPSTPPESVGWFVDAVRRAG